jgi:hypothetical protein
MSTLLDEIIHLAEDGKQPLPDILRKCLRLGHELKNERLKSWVTQELYGYDSDKDLPTYRTIAGPAYSAHERLNQAQVNESIRDERDDHVVGELEIILIALHRNRFDTGSNLSKSVRNLSEFHWLTRRGSIFFVFRTFFTVIINVSQ